MKVAIFSFAVTLISIFVVLASFMLFPTELGLIPASPYSSELEKLAAEGEVTLTQKEYERLLDLIEANDLWYRERMEISSEELISMEREDWQRRSSLLAPAVMLIWGVLFYFFYMRWPSRYALLVLSFPILFAVAGAMTVIEVLLIAFAVLVVRFRFGYTTDRDAPLN